MIVACLCLATNVLALPAASLIRRRGWVVAAWAALALLFAPRACRVQQVLALRGGGSESTEASRATELLKKAFPTPFADYVAIVVHGPVRWTNPRFGTILDTLKAAAEQRPYVSQVISLRSIGESTFVSEDRRTTFLIAALTPESTRDLSASFVPDLRAAIRDALARAPGAAGFDVMVTGFPALDHDVRTISAEDTERGEQRALPLTLLVLIVAFGALVAAALPVIVGLLAITFAPAVPALLGRSIDRPKWRARPLARFHAPTGWERWARWLGHRPWRAALVGGMAVALLTFPVSKIRLGLPATNWFPPESESGQGLEALREMGASGVIQPVRVVVQLPEGESAISGRRLPGLKALTDSIRKDPRVKEVRGVATIKTGMSTLQLAIYYSEPDAVRAKNPKFFDAYLSADNRVTLLDVIPADTVSLTGLMDVVRRVRAVVARDVRGLAGAEILVAGFAASNVDTQQELMKRFPETVALVLGITAIMLFVAFRSLLVPIKAVLLNLLSVGGAFGLTVLAFQPAYAGRLFGLDGPTEAIWAVVPGLGV